MSYILPFLTNVTRSRSRRVKWLLEFGDMSIEWHRFFLFLLSSGRSRKSSFPWKA